MCARRFLDFETRLAISQTSKRFRKLNWTLEDQKISNENFNYSLLAAWSIAIYDFLELSGPFAYSILFTVRRLPRCCRKYRKVAGRMFQFVRNLKEYERQGIISFNVFEPREHDILSDAGQVFQKLGEIDMESAKAFIAKFVEAYDRKGYRFVIGYDKVFFVLYKTPVDTRLREWKLHEEYEFDSNDERALKYMKN